MIANQVRPVVSRPSDLAACDTLRVCIVAENASFRFGGEASLPLHYFSRLRQRGIEAWLIVHSRTQPELEALFPADQDRIQYIPDVWYHRLIWRLGMWLPRRVSEATFGTLMVLINQLIQRSMIKRLIRHCGINIVHQPIPVSPRAPSLICGLKVPVVIGPMNGGMEYPPVFRGNESLFTRAAVGMGRASANFVNNVIAGKKLATILLVANQRTRLALPNCNTGEIIEIAENGVDLAIWSPAVRAEPENFPRFLFVGRLVDWKRLDFLLYVLTDFPEARLEVIGDGPMRDAWASMADHLGVSDRVQWLGWLPQPECARRLRYSTALLLPSIYECGGAVVLEAMACGIPVVAIAWGGPTDYIDESCGILITPSTSNLIIRGFLEAQRRLAADPQYRARLGAAGRKRVEMLFDWNKKIDRILEIYRHGLLRHKNESAIE